MQILLTNDDGIDAPGLAALCSGLSSLGEVYVVAPSGVQSASSHAITIDGPLAVRKMDIDDALCAWAVDGRPADCVKLALAALLPGRPDLVVAGINDGANVGQSVLYSGTVAAAAEGSVHNIPSVAVSMEWGDKKDFVRAARIAVPLIAHWLEASKEHDSSSRLVSINIPDLVDGRPLGVRIGAQAVQRSDETYERRDGPGGGTRPAGSDRPAGEPVGDSDGVSHYALSGWFSDDVHPETDVGLVRDGYVAITPLHIDRTEHRRLTALSECDWPDVTRM